MRVSHTDSIPPSRRQLLGPQIRKVASLSRAGSIPRVLRRDEPARRNYASAVAVDYSRRPSCDP